MSGVADGGWMDGPLASGEGSGVGDSSLTLVCWGMEPELIRQIYQGGTYLVPSLGRRTIRATPENNESAEYYDGHWTASHWVAQVHSI